MTTLQKRDLEENQLLITYRVGPEFHGWRLDAFLKHHYRKRSREKLKAVIESGAVSVKRDQSSHLHLGKLKPSTQVLAGDEIAVLTRKKKEPEVSLDYKILYQDEALFVVDKPANLPVHPAGSYFFNTLLIQLRTQGALKGSPIGIPSLSAEKEYYPVHRLDKETSGVLVLAREKEMCASLVAQFAERKTRKKYLAIVHGAPQEKEFSVDLPLMRDPEAPVKLMMKPELSHPERLPALTEFRVIETRGKYSLLECFPKTGRQHQIRVHLAAIDCPIVGDKLYSLPLEDVVDYYDRRNLSAEAIHRLGLPRHALHAASIQFLDPRTQEKLEFSSPFPEDLRRFFESAR